MTAENQENKKNVPQFKEYFLKIKSTIQDADLDAFGKLSNDEERIKFVSELIPTENQPPVEYLGNGKDEDQSKKLKELGNKAFGKSDYKEALKNYSESCMVNPQKEDSTDLALTIANRSAVLYHLQEYQAAIDDINLALSLNYPQDLKYKVFERKAKCLLALRRHEEALLEFRNTVKALDDCKLPKERKVKLQTDVQIMLEIMAKPSLSSGHVNAFLSGTDDGKHSEVSSAELSNPSMKNGVYEAASEKVEIQEDPSAGRFACASADIAPGEQILTEKAYCSVLLGEYSKTNCQHCFKRPVAPYPCDNCAFVIFCSLKCKELACATYHKFECPVFRNLQESGLSVTVLMAIRIISQQNLKYFLQLKDNLEVPTEEVKTYKSADYRNVYHLVRHQGLRKRDDFFERSIVALFLLRCLIKGNYFGDSSTGLLTSKPEMPDRYMNGSGLSREKQFIGGLLLRHLQILQFNAHEISELEIKEKNLENSKSLFIGGGLYATLALFNHSCDPGIVRYFEGTKVVVRAVKPIKKGEMIAENYGPIYSQMKKKERQEKLQTQYWFKCTCDPCEQLWPTFDDLDKNIIRFRCDARKASGERWNDCKNVLCVATNTEDFMIKCFLCGQMTNLFKGLKALQDTDATYQRASIDVTKGNYKEALGRYLEILTRLNEILAPPFRDYLLCQQFIRKCMLTFGNKYVKQV